MKTLADLKRDAKTGNFYGKLISWYGETPDEKRAQKAKIIDANTVSIFFDRGGKRSALDLPAASLVEYTGESLTIFEKGLRELNDEEKAIMAKWKEIEKTPAYQKQLEIDALTDGTMTFYQEASFFENAGFPYLSPRSCSSPLKYDRGENKIRDPKIRGQVLLQYEITKGDQQNGTGN